MIVLSQRAPCLPERRSPASGIILYDDDCGFCRWSLAKLLAWDRRMALRPVPIDTEEGRRLLSELGEEERQSSWHLVAAGRRYSAGAAFPPLLRLLPGGRPLAWLAARLPRAAEAGYAFVASRRGTIGPRITEGAKRRADERIRRRSAG
jgi:predicted DCC family thiol-disulfide oxidoreductase YuxK